jgi:1-acyl-sn-glycerol-3-phosphate acyltransferase
VRLALREQVPVVPIVAHGSHDIFVVLTRGEAFARRVGLNKLRIHIFPLVVAPPWGLEVAHLGALPLPAKVTVRVCEPLDWTRYGPEAADDEAVVRRCYEEALGRMQATMDDLVARVPHPVLSRVRAATGLDRFF